MNPQIEEIVVDGKTYVPKESIKEPIANSDVKIVVLQRGWVAIGKYKRVGDEGQLYPAAIIRTWGTTKGLPELVNGPTSQTKLDKSDSTIRFNIGSEILLIDASANKWEKHL